MSYAQRRQMSSNRTAAIVIVALCLYSADSDEKHVARSDAVQKAESR